MFHSWLMPVAMAEEVQAEVPQPPPYPPQKDIANVWEIVRVLFAIRWRRTLTTLSVTSLRRFLKLSVDLSRTSASSVVQGLQARCHFSVVERIHRLVFLVSLARR